MSLTVSPETTSGPSVIINDEVAKAHRREIEQLLAVIEQNEPDTSSETLGRLKKALTSIRSNRKKLEDLFRRSHSPMGSRNNIHYSSEWVGIQRLAQVTFDADADTPFYLLSTHPLHERILLPGFYDSHTVSYHQEQGWFMQKISGTIDYVEKLKVKTKNDASHLLLGSKVKQGEERASMIDSTDPRNTQVMPDGPNDKGEYVWGAWGGRLSPGLRVKSLVGTAPIDMIERQSKELGDELEAFKH